MRLGRDEDRRRAMGVAARRSAARYSWGAVVAKHVALYDLFAPRPA
jgi:hypothetical protein